MKQNNPNTTQQDGHELKILTEYYDAVNDRGKTFELRKNDRNFKTGETLLLRKYDPIKKVFTGRELKRIITHIFNDGNYGLSSEYVILGIR